MNQIANQTAFSRPWWLLPVGRLNPLWWIAFAAVVLWLDYAYGPDSQFPVLYVIPVTLAAWYSGRWTGLTLAILIPLSHIVFLLAVWNTPQPAELVVATLFRGAIIIVMALWFARLSEHERLMQRHVQRLEGLLPICAFCKNIKNESGEWERLETFISKRSEAQFSHGFCPTCRDKHYPNNEDAIQT